MKRVLSLILFGVLLFGLCACASELPQGSQDVSASDSGGGESLSSETVSSSADSSSVTDSDEASDGASSATASSESSDAVPDSNISDITSSETTDAGASSDDVPSTPDFTPQPVPVPPSPEPEPEPEFEPEPEPEPEPLVSYEENKAAADAVLKSSQHLVALCDQINGRIIVCDLAEDDWSNDNAVVWEYYHYGKKKSIYVDGLKFRDSPYYGEKVMIYCYPDGFRILSYETKRILREVNGESKVGVNIHSVELLPDGTVITASSNDNLVNVFAPGNSTTPCQTFEHTNSHGVMWDPLYQVVWGVGGNKLVAYTVSTVSGTPQLTRKKTYYTPTSGLHDLAADYGDPHRLLVTCAGGVYAFDKRTETMHYSYSGGVVGKTKTYVPGCGLFADGVFAFTAIESHNKVYKDWCTNQVQYYVPLNEKQGCLIVRTMPTDAYYKLRIMNFNYQ